MTSYVPATLKWSDTIPHCPKCRIPAAPIDAVDTLVALRGELLAHVGTIDALVVGLGALSLDDPDAASSTSPQQKNRQHVSHSS